ISKRGHLPIEPFERIWAKAVGPRQAGPQMSDPEPFHPRDGILQPVVFEMKPLAQAKCRSEFSESVERELWRTVLAQDAHVEVPVIGGPFRFFVPRRCLPSARQIIEAIPV